MIGNDDSNHIDPNAPVGDFSTAHTDPLAQQPGESRESWKERTFAAHYGMGSAKLDQLDEVEAQKRIKVRAKLDQLEKAVLDAVYAEAQFKAMPEYQRMMNFAEKDETQGTTESEVKEFFDDLKATSHPGGFAALIVRSLTLPAEREQAVKAYHEYRSMAESLWLA